MYPIQVARNRLQKVNTQKECLGTWERESESEGRFVSNIKLLQQL